MKKIIFGALIGVILVIAGFMIGAGTQGAPALVYVYSDSMEPLIKVHDAFIIWPSKNWDIGDIVMYRPTVLKAPAITHRIIGLSPRGYITKGDNAPYSDQSSGEPDLQPDRIVGKVVTLGRQPIIIPGLGYFSAGIQSTWGKYAKYLSIFFFSAAFLNLWLGRKALHRRIKSRQRLRLKTIYQWTAGISILIILLSVYAGSRVLQVKYLVSEYPGNPKEQVEVHRPGQLTLKIQNKGLFPVWSMTHGISPLSVRSAPDFLPPLSDGTLVLSVLPHSQTGLYQGYVQVYAYPTFLPRPWVEALHQKHPALVLLALGAVLGAVFYLIIRLLNRIPGLEGWIPVKSIQDKLTDRRLQRIKRKIIGRRKERVK